MFRLILSGLTLFIILVALGVPVYVLAWIIGLFSQDLKDRFSLSYMRFMARCLRWSTGMRITVKGEENLPAPDEPVLYVSNHRSYFDSVLAYLLVTGKTSIIAKKELRSVPFLSWWMSNTGCLFLDRSDPRQGMKIVLESAERLKNGTYSVWIFPEGTRLHADTITEFREGSFKIATKAEAPIIPIAFNRTDDIFENHTPWVRSANITVTIGTPIPTAGLSRPEQKQLCARIQEEIQQMYDEGK